MNCPKCNKKMIIPSWKYCNECDRKPQRKINIKTIKTMSARKRNKNETEKEKESRLVKTNIFIQELLGETIDMLMYDEDLGKDYLIGYRKV